ncbi:MAG: hypothetical protein CSA66_08000 [Proteobacteria bacterium]|nr:MAG: hypothetical protein CSA66_08000 [Pseudomonadota bacterium]
MVRSRNEVIERQDAKKQLERAADPRRLLRPLAFEELLLKDRGRLDALRTVEDCRRAASAARLSLRRGEYPRFVAWVESRYGTAFARRAGLPVGAPRLTLAS